MRARSTTRRRSGRESRSSRAAGRRGPRSRRSSRCSTRSRPAIVRAKAEVRRAAKPLVRRSILRDIAADAVSPADLPRAKHSVATSGPEYGEQDADQAIAAALHLALRPDSAPAQPGAHAAEPFDLG